MIIIGRAFSWHRPYYILVNNKWYKVNKIKFYKDNQVIVESQSGWLETESKDIKELELPINEIKLKRKEAFDGKVFIISKGKEWCGNETIADVYIPADMLNIHFAKHEIKYQQLRKVYEGEQGIYISVFVKSLLVELNAIREEYEEIYKQLDIYSMKTNRADIVYENINKLKELAEKYKAEQKRVYEFKVEDVVAEEKDDE